MHMAPNTIILIANQLFPFQNTSAEQVQCSTAQQNTAHRKQQQQQHKYASIMSEHVAIHNHGKEMEVAAAATVAANNNKLQIYILILLCRRA